jgi:Fe-S-cluster formation regulator IscX/YfhJ
MTQITIDLPENLFQSAQHLGKATARNLSDILTDTLEIILPVFNDLSQTSNYKTIDHLSNPEVIEVADLKMALVQNQRLDDSHKQKAERALSALSAFCFR